MSRGVSQARFLDFGEDAFVWLRHRGNERNDNTRRVRMAVLYGQAYSHAVEVQCRIQGLTCSGKDGRRVQTRVSRRVKTSSARRREAYEVRGLCRTCRLAELMLGQLYELLSAGNLNLGLLR